MHIGGPGEAKNNQILLVCIIPDHTIAHRQVVTFHHFWASNPFLLLSGHWPDFETPSSSPPPPPRGEGWSTFDFPLKKLTPSAPLTSLHFWPTWDLKKRRHQKRLLEGLPGPKPVSLWGETVSPPPPHSAEGTFWHLSIPGPPGVAPKGSLLRFGLHGSRVRDGYEEVAGEVEGPL